MSWGKRGDMIVLGTDPLNAETPRAVLGEHELTSVDAFYVRNHGPVPRPRPGHWRLRVDGLVDRPQELSLARLRENFATCEVVAALQCAGNRRVDLLRVRDVPGELPWGPGATGNARWNAAIDSSVDCRGCTPVRIAWFSAGSPNASYPIGCSTR